ncbi:neuronal PAS domain-containing protein 2-like isoform X2 [Liolophura sinensis]|uniref:neuronal PAS domain-containing protein 2-like isoform X2 n=1 Tax=Liolophura sinensis TaxID=3198878 RepID=UPI00315877E9
MSYDKRPGHLRSPSRNDVKTRNLSEKKRRDQFNMLINELCSMVSTNNRKMDKSTVLKSTIAFLKNYQEISMQSQAHEIKENWKPSFLSNDEFTQLMLEALDSFILVFSQQGTVLYASESVTSLLGHLPTDIVNLSIFDLIHEDEKINLYNMITQCAIENKDAQSLERDDHQFSLTCHLKRGLLLPTDQQVYEFVRLTGNVRHWNGDCSATNVDSDDETTSKTVEGFSSKPADTVCFCCTVRLETSPLIREMSVVDDVQTEFTSRHSMEWKFLFLDHRAPPIIGYLPFELLGTSGYDYYHPDDLEKISNCHEQLMLTGEGKSCPYRFLTKGQQWIWLKTRFYITYHQWNCKPEFIVSTHTLISYADVRSQLRQEEGGPEESPLRRSPSVCSVTSGVQEGSRWSSTASQRSTSPDKQSTGAHAQNADTPQKPHSTAQLSPRAPHPQEPHVSTHPTSCLPIQGILVPSNMFVSPGSTLQPPSRVLSPLVSQSPTSTVTPLPLSSPSLSSPQPRPLVPSQVYLTPAQQHLHKQLQQKSQLLQQAILQQQEELRLINSQLAISAPTTQQQQQAVDTTGHMVVGSPPQAFQRMSTFASPIGPQTTATPTSTVSSQMESAHEIASQQQQFYPFQFLQQPPEMLFQPTGPDTNCLPHTSSLPK